MRHPTFHWKLKGTISTERPSTIYRFDGIDNWWFLQLLWYHIISLLHQLTRIWSFSLGRAGTRSINSLTELLYAVPLSKSYYPRSRSSFCDIRIRRALIDFTALAATKLEMKRSFTSLLVQQACVFLCVFACVDVLFLYLYPWREGIGSTATR